MLSSNEGFSYPESFDVDAVSDITGISISNMEYKEHGSQDSSSIGSDNTELLLNQNISLRELDGEDSLLDSVSQVGGHEEHYNHHENFSINPKQHPLSNKYGFKNSNASQEGMPNHLHSQPVISQNSSYFQEMKTIMASETSQEPGARQSLLELKENYHPNINKVDNLSPPKYLTRKYPSDPNILGSGRHSVIKHHSSLASVKPDVNPSLHSSINPDAHASSVVEKQRFVNPEQHGRTRQVWFQPESPVEDTFQDTLLIINTRSGQQNVEIPSKSNAKNGLQNKSFMKDHFVSGDCKHASDSHDKFLMVDPTNVKNLGSHEAHLNSDYEERYPSQAQLGPSLDSSHGNLSHEINGDNDMQELLLGIKHDPNTNELYDDKVREGANLLSRILGGDHSGSFNTYSSTSRSSEKTEKTKSSLFRESLPDYTQRSLDNSLNGEDKLNGSSPFKMYESQLSHSSGNYIDPREPKEATTVLSASQTLPGTSVHNSGSECYQPQDRPGLHDGQTSHNAGTIPRSDRGTQERANEYIKNGYGVNSERREGISRTLDPVGESCSSVGNNIEVRGVEEALHNKVEELQILEMDVEEIQSRKKMAMHDLKVLEESLNRSKADISSSESLVEQYRWQATQTRSELMALEKTRDQLQEECNALNESIKKSKRNETFNSDEVMFGRSKEEIFTSLQERDRFKKELELTQETLKREKERSKLAQDDLRAKIRTLEDDLSKQHKDTVENLKKMKEQLSKERQKVRTVQHEKLNAINTLHDEMKDLREKEIEAIRAQMLRERASNIELLEEKFKRESNHLKKAAENAESRIKQLEASLVGRNEEINKLRHQHREEKQKNLDSDKQWRAQLESERQDAAIRMDEQERTFKDRESKLLRLQMELENLIDERTGDLRRSEERCRAQTEELQKIIENKNEEVRLVRGLVRQQEDATRVLGERLRSEAREHVRNAVEKERQSLSKEKERVSRTLNEEKEKNARAVKQLTEQIEMEKESHLQTKQTLNKFKREAEELRKQVVEVHGEKITSVQRARQEGCEELEKIKEKLQQADKLERIDKETAKAIYEECRKVADMVGLSTPLKTPTRLPDEKPGEKFDDSEESPTKEALASLRHCNSELRERLADMKKQMDKQQAENDQIKHSVVKSSPNEDVSSLEKLLREREEEIQRLHKNYGDKIHRLQAEKKKEQMTYRRTVAKLEQEFQKLITANVSVAGSSRVNKRDTFSRNSSNSTSGGHIGHTGNGHTYSQNSSVETPSRSAETSSSTDLLKHLQDRVKKLRAENENLKKSAEKGTSFHSFKHTGNMKELTNSDSVQSQNKSLTISQLHSPVKSSPINTRQNSELVSGSMEQITRLQRLLASTTKDGSAVTQTNTG